MAKQPNEETEKAHFKIVHLTMTKSIFEICDFPWKNVIKT